MPEGSMNAAKSFPPFYKELKTDKDIDLTDALVLSDDRPVFDKLNNKWNEEWRQLAIDNRTDRSSRNAKFRFSDESRF